MTPRRCSLVALSLAALAAAAPAAAQSKLYPKPAVDAEAEAEARSEFWDEVVQPGARRYAQIVTTATDILRLRTGDPARAREQLLEATGLRGDLAEGWGYLGVATERTREWKLCAAAYGKAYQLAATWRPTRLASRSDPSAANRAAASRPLELGWATCLSRSGDESGATLALEALVARGDATGDAWLRLGEVYMAAGRLAEAITAFEQARNDRIGGARARWLLAVAYDRARRPGDADAIAADAGDVNNATRSSADPFVPAADYYYVRAFGARNAPERALALYRTYLDQAPSDSPWRARAQEHVDALVDVDLATRIELEGAGDRDAIEKAVRGALPALRRCVASVPMVLVELRVTQLGPPGKPPRASSPPPPAPRLGGRRPVPPMPRYRPPTTLGRLPPDGQSAGVRAVAVIFDPGVLDAARDLAVDCVEKVGLGLSLPRPGPGTYSTVRIPVVADR